MSEVHVEVIYEGDHCIPCVYMANVVEVATAKFDREVRWNKVVLREKAGAKRFYELSNSLGRPAPIPSIFINGKLCFNTTPSVEEMEAAIRATSE